MVDVRRSGSIQCLNDIHLLLPPSPIYQLLQGCRRMRLGQRRIEFDRPLRCAADPWAKLHQGRSTRDQEKDVRICQPGNKPVRNLILATAWFN